MSIEIVILIIGFAALMAAFCLFVIGLVYSEVINSKIPPGVANSGKLHIVHGFIIGIAVLGRILAHLGLCDQQIFMRHCTDWFGRHNRPITHCLRIKDFFFAGIPVRVYEPTTPLDQKRRGLVYIHGGGWVLGSIDLYDGVCRHMAKETDTVVVSVGYRLAPEHRFPTHLDDCESATSHFLYVAPEFGVDPFRVALAGDSAGGNLAAALCQRLAQKRDWNLPTPCALILIYPALQMADFTLPSYQQNHAVPMLFRARMVFYYLQYLNGDMSVCQDVIEGRHVPADLKLHYSKWLDTANLPPGFRNGNKIKPVVAYDGEVYNIIKDGFKSEFSPLLAEDDVLRLTPPTFILTCQYDVLRDDGILFQKRLKDLGVKVKWYNIPNGVHGVLTFFEKGWLNFSAGTSAMEQIVSYLKTF